MQLVKTKNVKSIVETLEASISDFMNSEKYLKYLRFMSKFHGYSMNNIFLILKQCPEASLVAGYKKWQTLGRHVKQGEKAISILCPCFERHKQKVKDKDKKPVLDENGNEVEEEIIFPHFRIGNVFDISQTEGKELDLLEPTLLTDSVEDYDSFVQKLISISPVPVSFEEVEGGAKGYFSPSAEKIVIQKDMPQTQTLKTLIHESVHARLHSTKAMEGIKKDRMTKEIEAESVAFCVMTACGLDTSEYSFPYIAGWSSGRDMKELKASLETIRVTADEIIKELQKES